MSFFFPPFSFETRVSVRKWGMGDVCTCADLRARASQPVLRGWEGGTGRRPWLGWGGVRWGVMGTRLDDLMIYFPEP